MTHDYVSQEIGTCDGDQEIVSHDCENWNGWMIDHEICLIVVVIGVNGAMNAQCNPGPWELHSSWMMLTRMMKNGRDQKLVFALVDMRGQHSARLQVLMVACTEPLGKRAREVPA